MKIQGTAEGATFSKDKLREIMNIGEMGILELIKIQKQELNL